MNAEHIRAFWQARMFRAGQFMDNARSDAEFEAARSLYNYARGAIEAHDWQYGRKW